jgi:hypothetical protein
MAAPALRVPYAFDPIIGPATVVVASSEAEGKRTTLGRRASEASRHEQVLRRRAAPYSFLRTDVSPSSAVTDGTPSRFPELMWR